MKKIIILYVFLALSCWGFGQIGYTHMDPGRPVEVVVVVNGHAIYDTAIAYTFLEKFKDKIVRKKSYPPIKGDKKLGIISKDGVLVCFLKRGVTIDFNKMEEIKKK